MQTNRMFQVIVASGISLTSYACGSTVIVATGSGSTSGGMSTSGGGQIGFPQETATCAPSQCSGVGGAGGGSGGTGGAVGVGGGSGGVGGTSGVGGFPAEGCAPDGQICVTSADCCSADCFNGVCGFPSEGPCAPIGVGCTMSAECCDQAQCVDGVCALSPPPMDAGTADSGMDGAADAGMACFPAETAIGCPDAGP